MGRIKIVGLVLVAGLASTGISATTAVAGLHLPEMGKCIARSRAPYSNASCTELAARKSGGSYAWVRSGSGEVAHTEAGLSVIESVTGRKIVCEGGGAAWGVPRIPSPKVFGGMSFSGCVEQPGGVSCGEIGSEPLKGGLEFLSGAGSPEPSVGLYLFPEYHHRHKHFANFVCGEHTVKVKGSVVSTIEPVDTMTTAFRQTYSASSGGLEIAFALKEPFEPAGLTQEAVTTTEQPVEIRAYVQ